MKKMDEQRRIYKHIFGAHIFGLCVAGIASTIGTTAGFNISGAGIGLVAGGVISIPWMIALAAFVWFRGDMIEDHPVIFTILGPLIVIGSNALFNGGLLKEVALSSISSSVLYLILVIRERRRNII